ncbi:MAG: 2-phospho-L-lactate guanylyltransferase [Gammaproteobacteria bacterium]|nr:2-phospho-L-lactate guanylyltransferase [Gammaproteobacteria bacterium]
MWALIPINNFDASMSRLSSLLNQEERTELTKILAIQTLNILNKIEAIDKIIVMTDETEWIESLSIEKIIAIDDFDVPILKKKIEKASNWMEKKNAKRIIYLSIDLPFINLTDVETFINSHKKGMTIVEAGKDGGTNALILDMPRMIDFQFGENSFEKHIRSAENANITVKVFKNRALSSDLDDENDFKKFKMHSYGVNSALT